MSHNITVEGGSAVRLKTAGKYCDRDIVVTATGGGDENFVGVKLSNFDESSYKLPRVADARSLQKIVDSVIPGNKEKVLTFILSYLFANVNANLNGGLYASLEEVYIPDGAGSLDYTFQNCSKLKKIHGDLSELTHVSATFNGCASLTDFPYMPNVMRLSGNAFAGCKGLTKANLYGGITSIHSSVFANCTNLLDIYVPWSEGEVANAPWGATNATIHYNTVYDENHEPIV